MAEAILVFGTFLCFVNAAAAERNSSMRGFWWSATVVCAMASLGWSSGTVDMVLAGALEAFRGTLSALPTFSMPSL